MLATCGEKLRRMNSVAYRGKAVALRRLGSYVEPTGGGGSHRSTSLRGATRTRARRARPPRLKSRGLPPILKPSPGFGGHLHGGLTPLCCPPTPGLYHARCHRAGASLAIFCATLETCPTVHHPPTLIRLGCTSARLLRVTCNTPSRNSAWIASVSMVSGSEITRSNSP